MTGTFSCNSMILVDPFPAQHILWIYEDLRWSWMASDAQALVSKVARREKLEAYPLLLTSVHCRVSQWGLYPHFSLHSGIAEGKFRLVWQTLEILIITIVSASSWGKRNGDPHTFTLTGNSLGLTLHRSEKFQCWTSLCEGPAKQHSVSSTSESCCNSQIRCSWLKKVRQCDLSWCKQLMCWAGFCYVNDCWYSFLVFYLTSIKFLCLALLLPSNNIQ